MIRPQSQESYQTNSTITNSFSHIAKRSSPHRPVSLQNSIIRANGFKNILDSSKISRKNSCKNAYRITYPSSVSNSYIWQQNMDD